MQESRHNGDVEVQRMPRDPHFTPMPLQIVPQTKSARELDREPFSNRHLKSCVNKAKKCKLESKSPTFHAKKREKNKNSLSDERKIISSTNKANKCNKMKNSEAIKKAREQLNMQQAKKQPLNPSDKRRVANARERTRVHTLSSAFNSLRQVIPCYSANQRLSKLTILKVAISYIAALDALNKDLGSSDVIMKFQDNVDLCTKALQSEYGRTKRRGWMLRS